MKTIGFISLFVLLNLVLASAQTPIPKGERGYIINNTAGKIMVENYQFLVTLDHKALVTAGKSRPDAADFFISPSDRSKRWHFWIVPGTENTSQMQVWVNIPTLQPGTKHHFYCHYGGSRTKSLANGDSTFLFFDDFKGAVMKTNKWQGSPQSYYDFNDSSLIVKASGCNSPTLNHSIQSHKIPLDTFSGYSLTVRHALKTYHNNTRCQIEVNGTTVETSVLANNWSWNMSGIVWANGTYDVSTHKGDSLQVGFRASLTANSACTHALANIDRVFLIRTLPNPPTLISCGNFSVSAIPTSASCYGLADGEINTLVALGIGQLQYLWNTNSTGSKLSGVPAGTYSVSVKDNRGCTTFDTVVVGQPSPLNIQFNTIGGTDGVCDGKSQAIVTGGTAPIQYSWTGSTIITDSIDQRCLGWQPLQVTDANGCSITDSTKIDTNFTYDFKKGAYEIPTTNNWKSKNEEFNTWGAAPDKTPIKCEPNSLGGRWFKLVSETNTVVARITRNGLRGFYAALEDSIGKSLGCKLSEYNEVNGVTTLMFDSLIPGKTYFLRVDANNNLHNGTFSLEIDDTLGYDFKKGAYEIPTTDNWKSKNEEFNTWGAAPDKTPIKCEPNSLGGRWFKLVSETNTVVARITRNGLRGFYAALEDSIGKSLGCKLSEYNEVNGVTTLMFDSLIPGKTYFLRVDANNNLHNGTFSLEIDDTLGYDFKKGAYEIPTTDNWKSKNEEFNTWGAAPDKTPIKCEPNSLGGRWFKLVSETNTVVARITRNGLRGFYAALEDSIGKSLGCKLSEYNEVNGVTTLMFDSLIPGKTYFLRVDANNNLHNGTFSLEIDDTLGYDFKKGAYEIPTTDNWKSKNEEFNTWGAAPDKTPIKCEPSSLGGRWFKLVSGTNTVVARITRNGLRGFYAALEDSIGKSLGCKLSEYNEVNGVTTLMFDSLIPGKTYFLRVDANNNLHNGTFSLEIDDTIGYDWKEGAKPIPHLDGWRSKPAEYSTIGATPDQQKSLCQGSGPYNNRWHVFDAATPKITIGIFYGGVNGTLRNPIIALWDADGNLVQCVNHGQAKNGRLLISVDTLTVGNQYYLSVDNLSGYTGSYRLMANAQFDYSLPSVSFPCRDTTFHMTVIARSKLNNVLGIGAVFSYDTSLITPTGAVSLDHRLSNIDSAIAFTSIDTAAGELLVSLYTLGKTYNGNGPLVHIEFETKSSLANGTSLTLKRLTESYVTGVDTSHFVYSGKVTSVKDKLFDGTISYWKSKSPIPSNTLTTSSITGLNANSSPISASTVQGNSNGFFQFDTDYSSRVLIERDVPDSVFIMPYINAADALLIKKVLIRDSSFVPNLYQLIAMDVNQDGQITEGDLTQISKRTIGTLKEFQQAWNYNDKGQKIVNKPSRDWLFLNPENLENEPSLSRSTVYPNDDGVGYSPQRIPVQTNQIDLPIDENPHSCFSEGDFYGLLLGDVDGNVSKNDSLVKGVEMVAPAELVFEIQKIESDTPKIKITLSLEKVTGNVQSLNFRALLPVCADFENLDFLLDNVYFEQSLSNNELQFTSYILKGFSENEPILSITLRTHEDCELLVHLWNGYLNGEEVPITVRWPETVETTGPDQSTIQLYPNPAKNVLWIEVPAQKDQKVQVFDLSGTLLLQERFSAQKHSLDVSALKPGSYLIRVVSAQENWQKRFIKM